MKGILALRRKLPSEKISISFSHQRLNVIESGGKNRRSQNAPLYDQRSTEWNEQEEFARHKANTLDKELVKRTPQRCPQHKLLQKFRSYKSEGYRERLGDTYQPTEFCFCFCTVIELIVVCR